MRQAFHPLLTIVLLSTACAFPDDWDGDGYAPPRDCNDLDPNVHPDAVDLEEDGIDQDCQNGDTLVRVEGLDHECEITQDNHIDCYGDNALGQTNFPRNYPAIWVWVQLAAGDNHTCALNNHGSVLCWGSNDHGQATPPDDLGAIVAIDARADSSIGWLEGPNGRPGVPRCWGICPDNVDPIR